MQGWKWFSGLLYHSRHLQSSGFDETSGLWDFAFQGEYGVASKFLPVSPIPWMDKRTHHETDSIAASNGNDWIGSLYDLQVHFGEMVPKASASRWAKCGVG